MLVHTHPSVLQGTLSPLHPAMLSCVCLPESATGLHDVHHMISPSLLESHQQIPPSWTYVRKSRSAAPSSCHLRSYPKHANCRSSQHQDWPVYPSPTYVPQQTHDQRQGLLHTASLHAKAAAAAAQECIQDAVRMAKGIRHHETGPVRNPGVNVPAGMLKVTLHDVELTQPSLCFGVIKIGPHWGRTATVTAAPKGTWDWEVSSISLWHHSCIKNTHHHQSSQ